MADNFTSMTVGNYVFEFDFDAKELGISCPGVQIVLPPDETIALGDFLFEVMSTIQRPPRIFPVKITSAE